jgi:hypothetical protein
LWHFLGLNFSSGTPTSVFKKNSNIPGDGKSSVLWNNMKNLVNFMKRLKNIKELCLADLKHEQFSQL